MPYTSGKVYLNDFLPIYVSYDTKFSEIALRNKKIIANPVVILSSVVIHKFRDKKLLSAIGYSSF